ncbi:glutamate-cysteine ligase family protein [Sulfurovum sp.]|uniref:glutamate-cysteine ligase family protein n=1 Tax=Sulfurovum sp. TaxID=1969726 RepID=UPI0025E291EA|nr:glutamate-cysteine ligase family protein [Sulfurovum sp.]
MIQIGIEHEFVFKNQNEDYLDFENTEFDTFQQIVNAFPFHKGDERYFECKSLEKRPKRCYVEGFERYDLSGQLIETLPKGIEIRTLPHATVDTVVKEFTESYTRLTNIATSFGLYPLLTGVNPYKTSVLLHRPLNQKELTLRTKEWLTIALDSMLVHGLQVNISMDHLSKEELEDLVHKLNYYVPYMIPFSFSSPFYNGDVFEGLSYRIFFRAGTRGLARLQKRKGVDVIEFGGFDACGSARLLRSLLLLFKGVLVDTTLTKRALAQNVEQVKRSSLKGFEDEEIKEEGRLVLNAAKVALGEEGKALELLETMFLTNDSYAARMKYSYKKTSSIMESISNRYSY